jgi:hypothetical protein
MKTIPLITAVIMMFSIGYIVNTHAQTETYSKITFYVH